LNFKAIKYFRVKSQTSNFKQLYKLQRKVHELCCEWIIASSAYNYNAKKFIAF